MGLLDKAKKREHQLTGQRTVPNKNLPDCYNSIDIITHLLIKNNNTLPLSKLQTYFDDKNKLEAWLNALEEKGVLSIAYPANVFKSPQVTLNKDYVEKERSRESLTKGTDDNLPSDRKLLEEYRFEADCIPSHVQIWSSRQTEVPLYRVHTPNIGLATKALLSSIITDMSGKVKLEEDAITDPEKLKLAKKKFLSQAYTEVKKHFPKSDDALLKAMSGYLVHKMYGLGPIEVILSDNWLEEVAINGANEPISVYHKKFGWLKTNTYAEDETQINTFASQIGRKVGKQINALRPIMDAHLLSGDRVSATLFPVSTHGNTITIRRFSRNPWTITHMLDPKHQTMSIEMAAFLWMAMQYEMNVMVAGGTASGKTSMLNSLCGLIPPNQRVISIEDTRELSLPKDLSWNWVPLTTKKSNAEGEGEVTMLNLLVASLRMRPDRMVVGEVREKKQAETLFEAMHTGHSAYSTFHADTVAQVKRRLIEQPIAIPPTELEALQLVLVQYRDRNTGIRKSLELAEVMNTGKVGDVDLNYLFRWRPRTDKFVPIDESVRIVEDMNLHTGFTPQEINKDLWSRQTILRWMLKQKIKEIDDVGRLMRLFYKERHTVEEAAVKDVKGRQFLKRHHES